MHTPSLTGSSKSPAHDHFVPRGTAKEPSAAAPPGPFPVTSGTHPVVSPFIVEENDPQKGPIDLLKVTQLGSCRAGLVSNSVF